jgi:hypothetical protein
VVTINGSASLILLSSDHIIVEPVSSPSRLFERLAYGNTHTLMLQDEHVHGRFRVASLAERKRLWWRNGIINGAFIASWCVFAPVSDVHILMFERTGSFLLL